MIINCRHLTEFAARALKHYAVELAERDRHADASDAREAAEIFEKIASIKRFDPKEDYTVVVALDTCVRAHQLAGEAKQ